MGASTHQFARFFVHPRHVFHLTRFWRRVMMVLVPLLAVGGTLSALNWPYRYRKIHPLLEDMFGNQVRIGGYHRTYFPHPGFLATNLTLTRRSATSKSSLGTIETLFVQGDWSDLLMLKDRVRLVEITGMHLQIPAPGKNATQEQRASSPPQGSSGSATDQFDGPATKIDYLRLHNTLLDILRENGGKYTFALRQLEVWDLQKGHAWRYKVDMQNPLPSGHIAADGEFGPLNGKNLGATPASGWFNYDAVRLSDIGILHGVLGSTGRFSGTLKALQAEAVADIPNFAVDDGQPTHVRGAIHCTVNALNGDVIMPEVEAETGGTIVRARGEVAGSPKITHLEVEVNNGRAEEVLRPFVHDKVPILGPATLQSNVFIAAPGKPFLERMVLDGRFSAPAERPTDADTEKSLTDFSHRETEHARDAKNGPRPVARNGDVLSSLEGPASIRNGIVSTPGLIFRVPGAMANMHGTFVLHGQSVHLTGTLKMDAKLSNAASGWKSVALKILDPFFRRKNHPGSQVPIAVIGSPGHYKVTQDITHSK